MAEQPAVQSIEAPHDHTESNDHAGAAGQCQHERTASCNQPEEEGKAADIDVEFRLKCPRWGQWLEAFGRQPDYTAAGDPQTPLAALLRHGVNELASLRLGEVVHQEALNHLGRRAPL